MRTPNFQTSAGFGPNQVSESTLGWGILAAFLWVAFQRPSLPSIGIAVSLMLFFAMQAALTFSRSGIWMGALSTFVAFAFLARNSRTLIMAVVIAVLVVPIGWFVIFPALDRFTGDKLSARFRDKGLTGRDTIALEELILFTEHPFLGVGPGMGETWRAKQFGDGNQAHTEFSRLLAEHGLLGVLALTVLFGMATGRLTHEQWAADQGSAV